jgi:putative acetyltransferase
VERFALIQVVVRLESPYHDGVARLIRELDAYQTSLYPAESNHLLDITSLADANVRFFVARRGSQAVGCGALRIDPDQFGEVKRMFVLPEARGLKVGRQILRCIEDQARREGVGCLRLETGIYQPEALALYRSAGFVERGPFGNYGPDPLSVFMEKAL